MQHHSLHRLLTGTVAGVLAVATSLPAAAAGPRSALSPAQGGVAPEYTKIVNKQLVSTTFQGDSLHYSLASGFTNIGTPIKFNCSAACTVVVQTMVQVQETNPYWAICPVIDSIDAVQGCNWQGLASGPSSVYVTGNGTYFWSLAAGKHTLQGRVYMSVAGALENWGMTVSQYQ